MVVVRALEPQDHSHWDTFVERCPEGTFFHRCGWKTVIENTLGHRHYYLLAESQDSGKTQIEGVLPLFEVKSRLFGHALISTPCCVYGGVACDTDRARQALLAHARQLAEQLNVDQLELRHRTPQTDSWPSKSKHATFRRQLDPDLEQNLLAMKRKQRAVIRQAIANDHQPRLERHIDHFYPIYSTSVRNLGTPVLPKRYFQALLDQFGQQCEVVTIFQDEQPRCSLMSFYFRDEVLPYYGGGLPASRQLKSMDFMYWDLIRRALDQGIHTYDFGRSKNDSGPYHYKRHWGFEPEPLHYEYHLVNARELPDLSPNNPKYRYFIEAWKRLPLPLSQWLGPLLSKHLG